MLSQLLQCPVTSGSQPYPILCGYAQWAAQIQQDAGMLPAKEEVPANAKAIPSTINRDDVTILPRCRMDRRGVRGGHYQVARHAERQPPWQQKAISRCQVHRFGNALYR